MRRLEIGPGWAYWEPKRLEGFETLDIQESEFIDHVADATKELPFEDGSFDLVYASHVLEHIHYVYIKDVLKEWARIIKPGGALEIWVPDGLKICQLFVDAETKKKTKRDMIKIDKRYRKVKDPCLWGNERIFAITGHKDMPFSIHKTIFSRRYLKKVLAEAGLINLQNLKDARGIKEEIRKDYGWMNMGVKGEKPDA